MVIPMKKLFNDIARHTRAVTAALLMASPAFAQMPGNRQQEERPLKDFVLVVKDPEFDLRSIYREFSKIEGGDELIIHIESLDVRMAVDTTEAAVGGFDPARNTITLTPTTGAMEGVLADLAYNLRRAQQHYDLKAGEMEQRLLSPAQFWTLKRYEEADARAFSAYMMSKRALQQGEQPGYSRLPGEIQDITDTLTEEWKNKKEITPERYRTLAFERAMSDIGQLPVRVRLTEPKESQGGYLSYFSLEDFHENLMEKIRRRYTALARDLAAVKAPGISADSYAEQAQSLRDHLASAPAAAEFETFLRSFGGTDVKAAAPTCLQSGDVDAHTINTLYAYRLGGDENTLEDRIDKLVQFMTQESETFRALRQEIESLPASLPQPKPATKPAAKPAVKSKTAAR